MTTSDKVVETVRIHYDKNKQLARITIPRQLCLVVKEHIPHKTKLLCRFCPKDKEFIISPLE